MNKKILLLHILTFSVVLISTFMSLSSLFYNITVLQLTTTALFISSFLYLVIFLWYTLYITLKSEKSKVYFSVLFFIFLIVCILIIFLILFTLKSLWCTKLTLLCLSICLLIFSVRFSVYVRNLKKPSYLEFNEAPKTAFCLVVLLFIVISSYVVLNIDVATIENKNRLTEVAFDNVNFELFPIENAYHPFYTNNTNNKTISWYTIDCEDIKYLQSREIKNTVLIKGIFVYEVHDDFRNFAIIKSERPKTIRNNEIQSFTYSFLFILLNLFIGYSLLLLSPYCSHFKIKYESIKIIWKSQDIILLLLSTIMISEVFKF